MIDKHEKNIWCVQFVCIIKGDKHTIIKWAIYNYLIRYRCSYQSVEQAIRSETLVFGGWCFDIFVERTFWIVHTIRQLFLIWSAQYSVFIWKHKNKTYWSEKKARDKPHNTLRCIWFLQRRRSQITIINLMFLVTLFIYFTVTSLKREW